MTRTRATTSRLWALSTLQPHSPRGLWHAHDHSGHERHGNSGVPTSFVLLRFTTSIQSLSTLSSSNASLRAQVEVFEFVVEHLPYVLWDLDDPSAESKGEDPTNTGDDNSQRMRSFLRRTILLTKEAQAEIAKRTEYLYLLKRHYEGSANLRKLMRGLALDGWFWMCERWRTVALNIYVPLSESQCWAILHETLDTTTAYDRERAKKNRVDFFGWRDWHHLDTDQRYVRFSTSKTLLNTEMEQVALQRRRLVQGGPPRRQLRVLPPGLAEDLARHLDPPVRRKYPNLEQLTHTLEITFRVKTETGYMIVSRSIESPRLQSLMKEEGLSLSGNFFCDTFEVAHRDAQGQCDAVRFTLTGSIGSDNPTYARRWHNEVLNSLVGSETKLADAPVLSIESSIKEDITSDSK